MQDFPWISIHLVNRILQNSAFAQELKDFQLNDFLQYIEGRRGVIATELNKWSLKNPDRVFTLKDNFPEWRDMDILEGIIQAEISRRSQSEPQRVKPGRKKNDPLPFDAFFKDKECLNRFLLACVSAGIICKDGEGFLWIDEGAKGHRVRAMWEAAKDLGIRKSKGVPNTTAVCKEIERFFNMESLSHTTLDESNTTHKDFQTVKAEIQKKFRELKD